MNEKIPREIIPMSYNQKISYTYTWRMAAYGRPWPRDLERQNPLQLLDWEMTCTSKHDAQTKKALRLLDMHTFC
jgi:hypothetical protein